MYRAEISINLLKYCGIWCPKFYVGRTRTIYNVFSYVMVIIVYTFTISTLLYLLLSNPNLEDFTESLFYVLALITACVKIAIVFSKRKEIIELRNILFEKQCSPQDSIEYYIQKKFDKIGRNGTITCLLFASVTIILKATAPLIKGLNAPLPYKSWIPYEINNRNIFWLTYIIQAVGSTTAGHITIAIDTFVMTMMTQLCAQLEILMHRIRKLPQFCMEEKSLKSNSHKQEVILGMWIQHHETIYQFGENLNNIYKWAFFFQLCGTTIDVCTSTYLLSSASITSTKFWTMVFSLSGILLQICLYCWPGNVVMEKSKEVGFATYSTDWTLLTKSSRTSLIHIIQRSGKPIKFTASWVAPMSIETFTSSSSELINDETSHWFKSFMTVNTSSPVSYSSRRCASHSTFSSDNSIIDSNILRMSYSIYNLLTHSQ